MLSTVHAVDYIVLIAYLCLMAGVGAYFMRFMRAGTDFLKGEIASSGGGGDGLLHVGLFGLDFTGGAGFAYRNGIIGTF